MIYTGNCRLGDLFESRREKGRPGLPLLSVTMNDGLVDRDELERKQDTSLAPEEHLLVKPGDIAYNMMRMWQGAFGLSDQEALVSPAYVVLKPKSKIDPLYASYLFKTTRLAYLFWAYSYGLTDDRLRLYYRDFARIPVSIPPQKTQRRIANALQTWDSTSLALKRLQVLGEAQSAQLFTSFFAPSSAKHERAHWRACALGEVAKMASGGTPPSNNAECFEGSIPWVSIVDMTRAGKFISRTERTLTPKGIENSSAKVFPKDTVLFAMYASIGECSIAEVDLATSQAILGIQPNPDLRAEYLYYFLRSRRAEFRRIGQKGAQANLNAEMVRQTRIRIPPLGEQDQILRVLRTADQVTNLYGRQNQLLRRERDAMVRGLTGGHASTTPSAGISSAT